jgi:hypothetical protein
MSNVKCIFCVIQNIMWFLKLLLDQNSVVIYHKFNSNLKITLFF